jgi:hypothetical protein
MGAWGDGPFESDGGLDEVFALLDHLTTKVEQIACGTGGDRSSAIRDEQELAANVALLCLVAEAAYRPAMFVPVRGMPLPDPEAVRAWRRKFVTRFGRLAKGQLEGSRADLRRYAREAAAPLDRLAALSRQQVAASEATHQQVNAEVAEARRREAAE